MTPMGPLRRHPANPRYFADPAGAPVVLAGSHTWGDFATDAGAGFPYERFLDMLDAYGHNFFRGWVWDLPRSRQGYNGGPFAFGPAPWRRTGPGIATDGLPRFDLTQWDPAFFERLAQRTAAAEARGIYVAVMLFQGYGWQFDRSDDDGFPYDGRNNVNGLDAGSGGAAATLEHPDVVAVQEEYARRVADAVAPHGNVLFEIANEAAPASTAWQHHHIRRLRAHLERSGRAAPIGMTFQFDGGSLADLESSGADWISPDSDPATRADPPATDGAQVVVYDTDHGYDWRALRSDGPDGQRAWVWRCGLRGANVLFMDPYLARIRIDGEVRNDPLGTDPAEPYYGTAPDPFWDPLRRVLGRLRTVLGRLELATAVPHPELASSGFCLADPGREYLAYRPADHPALRLRLEPGSYAVRWLDPEHDAEVALPDIAGPGEVAVPAPSRADGLVHVTRR
jgi:hypothetical protein